MDRLAGAFSHLRRESLELEARFGTWHGSAFEPTVDAARFQHVNQQLQASPHFSSSRCEESHVYHYIEQDRTPVRLETFFDSDKVAVRLEAMTKRRLHTIDVDMTERTVVRFALSSETRLVPTRNTVTPSLVRIRQRTSHTYTGSGMTVRYDLTRYWEAPSRTAAERARHSQPPKHSIELEVVALGKKATDEDRALSFYQKCADLCRLMEPQ